MFALHERALEDAKYCIRNVAKEEYDDKTDNKKYISVQCSL